MQKDLSSVQDVQRQLLSIVTKMGSNVDMLLHTDQPVSPVAADEKVADLVSSWAGARELSPLVEEDSEEEEDKGGLLLSDEEKKMTTVKTHPSGIAGPAVSGGHHSVSPPLVPFGGTLGKASTSGPFKLAGKRFWMTDQNHQDQASVGELQ